MEFWNEIILLISIKKVQNDIFAYDKVFLR